jgi:preprotein translocase subunit SecY
MVTLLMILLFGFFYILELLVERSSQAKEIKEAGGKEN